MVEKAFYYVHLKGVEPLTFPICNRDARSNYRSSFRALLNVHLKGVEPLTS